MAKMTGSRLILVFLLFSGLTFLSAQASFSEISKQITDEECIGCHSNRELTKQNSSGPPTSVYVDVEKLLGSTHQEAKCTQCHGKSAIMAPGAGKDLRHIKNLPRVSCNLTCHQENGQLQYKDSIHGRLASHAGGEDVAHCQDCHGGHDVVKCTDPVTKQPQCDPCQGCSKCHENEALVVKHNIHKQHPCLQWQLSVHGTPRSIDGKMKVSATCTDCHGVHSIQGMGTPNLSVRQPQNCGKCHAKELAEYLDSIHGKKAMIDKDPEAPLCVDCHGEHDILAPGIAGSKVNTLNIPDTCSSCHARPSLMKKYGIEPDKIPTFINSFHGIALQLNDKAAATCASCHGHHLVLPASDPKSTVYSANLQKTCGQLNCHPNMPQRIASAKIHVDYSSPKAGAIYWVQKVMMWALIMLIAISFIWVIPDLLNRVRMRKTKDNGNSRK